MPEPTESLLRDIRKALEIQPDMVRSDTGERGDGELGELIQRIDATLAAPTGEPVAWRVACDLGSHGCYRTIFVQPESAQATATRLNFEKDHGEHFAQALYIHPAPSGGEPVISGIDNIRRSLGVPVPPDAPVEVRHARWLHQVATEGEVCNDDSPFAAMLMEIAECLTEHGYGAPSEPVAWRVVCADGVAGSDHLIGTPSGQRAKMLFLEEWEARDHVRYADDCSACGPHRIEPLGVIHE